MCLKKYKGRILIVLLVVLSLVVAFRMGESQVETPPPTVPTVTAPDITEKEDVTEDVAPVPLAPPEEEVVPPQTLEPVPEVVEPPVMIPEVVPEESIPEEVEKQPTVTLSVSCGTVLDHWDKLDADKQELIPADGVIYPETEITLVEGESVFDLLLRVMQEEKIHLEYSATPVYQSAYIEGIGNLYEFDCGPMSGWVYKVNDWSPNYGCSRYTLENMDKVELLYTCDLGADVGGNMVTE